MQTLLAREQNILVERENVASHPVDVAQILLGNLGDSMLKKESIFSLPSLGEIFRPVLATGRTENIASWGRLDFC